MSGILPTSICLLSGLMLAGSFPPVDLPYLAWFGLCPLLYYWKVGKSELAIFIAVYLSFALAFMIAFGWVASHALESTAWISFGVLCGMPIFNTLPFFFSFRVARRLGPAAGDISLVVFFLFSEFLLLRGPIPMPWILLGNSQANEPWVSQLAEYAGVPGLSLWLMIVNLLAARLLSARTSRSRMISGGLCVLILAGTLLLGRHALHRTYRPDGELVIGIVQPAVKAIEWSQPSDSTRIQHLLVLSDGLVRGGTPIPDWIVWPETALPYSFFLPDSAGLYPDLQAWVDRNDVILITGAVRPSDQSSNVFRNSVITWEPTKPVQKYDKSILVPFAEQVPFAESIQMLERLTVSSGGVSRYERGSGAQILNVNGIRTGMLICFESLFGYYAREYALQGARILVVVTQDGWWGRSAAPAQHLSFDRLRAIENRKAVVHVSVSGVSAYILPDGTIRERTDWMEATVKTHQIPLRSQQTFYSRYGDLASWAGVSGTVLFIILAMFTGKWKRSSRSGPES